MRRSIAVDGEGFERCALRRDQAETVVYARLAQRAFDHDQSVFGLPCAEIGHLGDFLFRHGSRGFQCRCAPAFGEVEGEDIDLEQLKWVVLMVLFNQPGKEAVFAWMEDIVLDKASGRLH